MILLFLYDENMSRIAKKLPGHLHNTCNVLQYRLSWFAFYTEYKHK